MQTYENESTTSSFIVWIDYFCTLQTVTLFSLSLKVLVYTYTCGIHIAPGNPCEPFAFSDTSSQTSKLRIQYNHSLGKQFFQINRPVHLCKPFFIHILVNRKVLPMDIFNSFDLEFGSHAVLKSTYATYV